MTKLLSIMTIGCVLALAGTAHAEERAKTSQQNKMALCNKEAAGKKGDERKSFMKTCLSAKKEAQQGKA